MDKAHFCRDEQGSDMEPSVGLTSAHAQHATLSQKVSALCVPEDPYGLGLKVCIPPRACMSAVCLPCASVGQGTSLACLGILDHRTDDSKTPKNDPSPLRQPIRVAKFLVMVPFWLHGT